jgi:predicted RNA-binding protein YlqC (UPF0109 family)
MRDLALQVCAGLGIAQDKVQVEQAEADGAVKLTLRMPVEAVQRLDGREHRVAKAVRQVLSAAAAAQGKRFELVAQAND